MLRSLLAACSILVLLFSTILFPTSAQACPVKLPTTLLSLYRDSDAIFVARYDKTVDHEIVEDTEERTVVMTRTRFDVSSTLKGENRKLFVLEEREYRYKNDTRDAESDEPDEEEEGDALYRRPELKSGDTVLLFLSADSDTKQLELTDYRDAIKKMSNERLAAYEARINDLNSIFSAKRVNNAAIVDWLIKCVQDPLTRWEGAFELQQSYERMLWQDRKNEEAKAEAKKEDETADSDATVALGDQAAASGAEESLEQPEVDESSTQAQTVFEITDKEWVDPATYARLLTDDQKEVLTNLLLDSTKQTVNPEKMKSSATTPGDQALLELVSNWGDTRLARFILDKIQVAGDGYTISQLMSSAAQVLKDDELQTIASDYSDAFYQEDDEIVEGTDTAAEQPDIPEPATDEIGSDDNSAVVDESETADVAVDTSTDNANAEASKKMTYKEFRAELLAKFFARSSVAIANADATKIEKAGK